MNWRHSSTGWRMLKQLRMAASGEQSPLHELRLAFWNWRGFLGFFCALSGSLYLLHVVTAILTERALYSDGAVFFMGLLRAEFPWPVFDDGKHIRLFVNYMNQFPSALAIKAGVADLRALKLLFGAGLFLLPIAIYFLCFLIIRRAGDYRLLFVLLASVVTCAMPSEIFIVNQAFTSLALCWLLLCYLLADCKTGPFDKALIVAILIALFRAHEGMLLWGPVLSCAALARLIRYRTYAPTSENWHIHAIGMAGILHAAFVAYWQLTHPVGEQTQAFLSLLTKVLPWAMWEISGATRISLLTGIALAAALAMIWLGGRAGLRPAARMALWMIILACAAASLHIAILPFHEFWRIEPWQEKNYRFLVNFGSVFWMGLAIVLWWKEVRFSRAERGLMWLVLAMGMSAGSVWQLANTRQWNEFQSHSEMFIQNADNVFISSSDLEDSFSEMGEGWLRMIADSWTWPAYSIAIQNAKVVRKIVVSDLRKDMLQFHGEEGYVVSASYVVFMSDAYFDFSHLLAARQGGERAEASAPLADG